MKLLDRSTLLGALGMVVLGIAFSVTSNFGAGPSRRLEWARDYPDPIPGKRNCPETLSEAPTATTPVETMPVATAPVVPTGEAPGTPSPTAPSDIPPTAAPDGPSAPAGTAPEPAASAPAAAATAPSETSAPPAPTAPQEPESSLHAVSIPPLPPGEAFVEVSPQQVDLLFDQGALFVDARMTSQYEEGHVAGALSIAIWEAGVAEKIAATVFEVQGDKSRPVVIYCNGGDCEDSHNLARMYYEDGYTALYVYKDGYPDWLSRARPIRMGAAR